MAGRQVKRPQTHTKKPQVKKVQPQEKKVRLQTDDMVFALDIGTRSIIGMVGYVEEGRIRIVAIEREEHAERSMIDGQIENIEKVAALAQKVKQRLEDKTGSRLTRVCVAAAGRALRTRRAEYEMTLAGTQLIDDEIISRLEAGAISAAEEAFDEENSIREDARRFYLAGYTVCQYYLDQYTMSSLKDHRGRHVKVDLIATFLPSEVVESLYTTMNKIDLEVASITLEPIAAINATIPENLRLLNLAMVDIGAGTSDIAACTGGSVTGYTMATVAGDEITEALMKAYLVDFKTAEEMKLQIETEEEITYTDILGFEQKLSRKQILSCIREAFDTLCREIADRIVEINGGAPSALFLAGGGSRLAGLRDGIADALKMDAARVAVAGNYFRANAYSEEYDLNSPEYATPLGIAISSGLNLINDSFRVILNGRPAKLFRSGSFTALNLLMMNGYNFRDILGRSGTGLTVTVNGRRKVFYGTAAQPASLLINKEEGQLSTVIHAGDSIDFVPAVQGVPAEACLGDIEGAAEALEVTLNGVAADLETPLRNGDIITLRRPAGWTEEGPEPAKNEKDTVAFTEDAGVIFAERSGNEAMEVPGTAAPAKKEEPAAPEKPAASSEISVFEKEVSVESFPAESPAMEKPAEVPEPVAPPATGPVAVSVSASSAGRSPESPVHPVPASAPAPALRAQADILFRLNGSPLRLPPKEDGSPYYLMDMIQYSGITPDKLKGTVRLSVNGLRGMFQQALKAGDDITIEEEGRSV